mmetsp:Transcript_49166/g.114989  ORF Transcript_49166/g.114989 Transcript_49166/m.114989 type:complete len:1321 (+) Transcript_49166:163-4125(+)
MAVTAALSREPVTMAAQITAVTSDKILENNWQKDLLDLHRVHSCCKDLFLLHHHYSEAVLRVSLEIITCPTAKKLLWWVDGWWSDEDQRARFKAIIREKLGIVLTTKGISVKAVQLNNQEEQDLIANLQSRCKSLEEQVTKARKAQQHAESQFQDIQNLKDAHQRTVEGLERSIEKLHQKVKELQGAAGSQEEEQKALKQHAKQLEESHAAVEKRLSQVQADLKAAQAAADAAVESEKNKVVEFDKRMAESVKTAADATKEALANKKLLEEALKQAEKAEEALNEAKSKLAKGADNSKEVKIQELKSQLVDQEQRTRAASKQCRAEAGRVQHLEERLAKVDEEAKKTEHELQHLKANMFQRSSVQAASFLEASDIHQAGSNKQTSRNYAKALATGQVHEQGIQVDVGDGSGDDTQDLGISDLRHDHEALQSVNADLQTEVSHLREQLHSFVNLAGENGLGASAEAIMEAARKRFEAAHSKGESCFMRLYHDAKRRFAKQNQEEASLMGHTPSQSHWHHDEHVMGSLEGTTPPRSRGAAFHPDASGHAASSRPSMRSIAKSIAMINTASGSRNGSRASTPAMQMGHASSHSPGLSALMQCAGTGMETRNRTPEKKGREGSAGLHAHDLAPDAARKPSKMDAQLAVIADGIDTQRRESTESAKQGDGRGQPSLVKVEERVTSKHTALATAERSEGESANAPQLPAAFPADSSNCCKAPSVPDEAPPEPSPPSSLPAPPEKVADEKQKDLQTRVLLPEKVEAAAPAAKPASGPAPAAMVTKKSEEPAVRPARAEAERIEERRAGAHAKKDQTTKGPVVHNVEKQHAAPTSRPEQTVKKETPPSKGLEGKGHETPDAAASEAKRAVAGGPTESKQHSDNQHDSHSDRLSAPEIPRPEKQQHTSAKAAQPEAAKTADLPRAATVPSAGSVEKGLVGSRQQKRVESKKAANQLDDAKFTGDRVLKAGKYVGASESLRDTAHRHSGGLPPDMVDTAVRRIKSTAELGTRRSRSPELPKRSETQLDRPISRTQLSSEDGRSLSELTTRASSPGSKAPRHLWFNQPTRTLMHNHTVPNLMETGSQVKGKGYALAGRLAPLLKPVHLEAANISTDARDKILKFGRDAIVDLADEDVEELAITICRAVSLPLLREGREPCDLPGHIVGPHSPKPYKGDADFIVRSWFGRMGDKRSSSPSSRRRSPSPLQRCRTATGSSRPTTVPSLDGKSRSTSPEEDFQQMKLGVAVLGTQLLGAPSDGKLSPLLPSLRPATSTVTMRARTPGALPGTRTTGGHAGRMGQTKSGPLAPMLLQQNTKPDVQLGVTGGSPRS